MVEFYSLGGGVDFLREEDGDESDYRVLDPPEVVDIGTATVQEASTELPLSAWYVVGEDDDREHVVVDLHPARLGTCYDVFHETFVLPDYANIVAASFSEFLERLHHRGRAYWFDKDFKRQAFGTPASDG